MSRIKLAVIVTHPVQYTAPVFRAMTQSGRLQLRVFYTWSQTGSGDFFDREFGARVTWDVPLLDGYDYQFIDNIARDPGPHRFGGIRTPDLCAAIAAWSADAVLVIGWNNHAHLQTMRHFKGRVPVFFRGDSTLLDNRSWFKSWFRRQVLRWIYRHVDVAISVGRASRDYFAWCGIPMSKIAFAPHCIDNRRFADADGGAQQQANAWRVQLGIDSQAVVIGFAGKLIAKKDPQLLLSAFVKSETTARLVIFGSGELETELRHLAGTHSGIHFMPFQNQSLMPAVYRLCDVFVLPSRGPGETWGLALNEAMASQRPVIASSMAGATQDLVHSGYNGWRFIAGDVDDLARALQAATEMGRDGLQQLGKNAQRFIQDWSTEVSAEKMADAVIRHCMSQPQDVFEPSPSRT